MSGANGLWVRRLRSSRGSEGGRAHCRGMRCRPTKQHISRRAVRNAARTLSEPLVCQPHRDGLKRLRGTCDKSLVALQIAGHHPSVGKVHRMPKELVRRKRERCREVARRGRPARQCAEHGPALWMCQSLEGTIKLLRHAPEYGVRRSVCAEATRVNLVAAAGSRTRAKTISGSLVSGRPDRYRGGTER